MKQQRSLFTGEQFDSRGRRVAVSGGGIVGSVRFIHSFVRSFVHSFVSREFPHFGGIVYTEIGPDKRGPFPILLICRN